ncbi:MAG: isoprenyl transferase [Ignavibacteriales bacterium]|nr:isoprenyl transferase [Ignavibacteriales bacterium]
MTKGPAQPSGQDKKLQEKLCEKGEIPQHIAIIMDGNGRWAKSRSLPRVAGHNEGVNSVRDIVEACGQLGVKFLTIYAFSTENWRRPKDEISVLMRLLLKALRDERDRLYSNNVRLKTIGDLSALPGDIQQELQEAMELMKHNTGLTLVLALSYSGRWDITNAMKRIAGEIETGKIRPGEIDDKVISYHLSTRGIPDPDLLIRTSGEMRISNFLLWQLAYTEFYITELLWPEFRRRALYDAVASFQQRERRFGMVSEQLQLKRKHAAVSYVERFLKSVSGN